VQPPDRGLLLTIRVSESEMSAFKRAAADAGMTVSAWCRTLARRAAGLPTI
jgi:hypothetical protein